MEVYRIHRLRLVRTTVPAQVGRNDPVVLREERHLGFPLQRLPAKAVQEYHRALRHAGVNVDHAQAQGRQFSHQHVTSIKFEVELHNRS